MIRGRRWRWRWRDTDGKETEKNKNKKIMLNDRAVPWGGSAEEEHGCTDPSPLISNKEKIWGDFLPMFGGERAFHPFTSLIYLSTPQESAFNPCPPLPSSTKAGEVEETLFVGASVGAQMCPQIQTTERTRITGHWSTVFSWSCKHESSFICFMWSNYIITLTLTWLDPGRM